MQKVKKATHVSLTAKSWERLTQQMQKLTLAAARRGAPKKVKVAA